MAQDDVQSPFLLAPNISPNASAYGTNVPFTDQQSSALAVPSSSPQGESSVQNFISRLSPTLGTQNANSIDASMKAADQSISALQQKQSAFWPTFIATAAALSGNFGPAFQLQEQKRKTAIARDMMPALYTIGQLRNQGQYQQALGYAEKLAAGVGDRSPELLGFVKNIADDLNKREWENTKAKQYVDIRSQTITKNDPDYNLFQALKKTAQAGTPVAWDTLKEIAQAKPHIQYINGQVVQTSQLTGETTQAPLAAGYEQRDVGGYIGKMVADAHGIGTPELQNILNRRDVEGISAGKAAEIRKDYWSLGSVAADLDISALAPVSPEYNAQLFAQGTPLIAAATRQGNMSSAMEGFFERQRRLKEQEIQATINLDPRMPHQGGFVYVDVGPNAGANYGRALPGISVAEAQKAGRERLQPMDERTYQQEFLPILNIKQGLGYLPEMFKSFGNTDTFIRNLAPGVDRVISQALGISITPDMTLGQAARAAINQALEQVNNTESLKSMPVGQLKQLMTGPFANSADAIKAANFLIDQMNTRLGRIVNEKNIRQDRLDESVKPAMPPKGTVPSQQQIDRIQKEYGITPNQGDPVPVPGSLKGGRKK